MLMLFSQVKKFDGAFSFCFSILVLALVSGISGQARYCQAQDRFWDNPAGGTFGTATNWNPASVPGANNNAIFQLLLPSTIQFTQNYTNDRLFVRAGVVIFNLGGRTYRLTNTDSAVPSIAVGQFVGNVAELRLHNGTLNGESATLGLNAGSSGTMRVGSNAEWNLSTQLTVGDSGNGSLFVDSGGQLHSFYETYIGDGAGSAGTVTVTGENSTWYNESGDVFVGYQGRGTLNILSAGVANSKHGTIATISDSQGTVLVSGDGSQWNVEDIVRVGEAGSGTMTVASGGVVTGYDTFIGSSQNGTGNVLVTDMDSRLSTQGLYVGFGGTGEFHVANGGLVESALLSIGHNAAGSGDMTVDGVGSRAIVSGTVEVGVHGFGTLEVTNGGVVENAAGRIAVNDGVGEATVAGNGSQWNNSSALTVGVGDSGYGYLNILDGGVVTNTDGYIGLNFGSTGAVLVNGQDSHWDNSGNLYVGYHGRGYLSIEDGGVVQSAGLALIGGEGLGGVEATGDVIVSGAGSQWHNTGGINIGWGELANGTLSIHAGGVASSTHAKVGFAGNGNAIISGVGSQWNNDGSLLIGDLSFGAMSVTTGGVVSSNSGGIGLQSGVTGTTDVTGPGSQWNISESLTVGQFGSGLLTVNSGGRVQNETGIVGRFSGGSGTVSVSGGASQWNNASNLEIGLGGQGTLNITSGATVTVGDTTEIGSNGIVNVSGPNSRFEFGQTTLPEFARINATGGSLAGSVSHTGFSHAASLTTLRNPLANLSEVYVRNSGILYGDSVLDAGLINVTVGEVEVSSGERLRFGGLNNSNAGEINNFGGQIRFSGALQNEVSGFVAGRGQFIADGGWSNAGAMAFSGGFSDLLGDLANEADGIVVTSGAGTTTFFDAVINQGEIRTSLAVSNSVFLGAVTGAGSFTGTGTVFMEGDLRPGNSPGVVSFGGDLVFGSTASTTFELGGLNPGEFDQLLVAGDLVLGGSELNVVLWDDFLLGPNMQFLIADVDGSLNGTYGGLSEGAFVGNFSGQDLFITYQGFGGQGGIGLFTAVPEPGATLPLLLLMLAGFTYRTRRVDSVGVRTTGRESSSSPGMGRIFRSVNSSARKTKILAATFTVVISLSPALALAQPEIVNLGVFPGGTNSISLGLSADGSTVTGYGFADGTNRAFRWTNSTGLEDLGTLPSYSQAIGYGVSGDGSVVVGGASGFTEAWRWTSSGEMQGLGTLGGTNSLATGVSADGSVVTGWSQYAGNPTQPQAFRWTETEGMVGLDFLTGARSTAAAISGDGLFVAGQANLSGTSLTGHAALWTPTGIVDLGALVDGGSSWATAISYDGSVVVGTSSTGNGDRAFRWTEADGMVNLGVVPPGGTFPLSTATAVSGDGLTVGGSHAGSYAFLWRADLGPVDLKTWLQSEGINTSGWTLSNVTGLSHDGSVITGTGFVDNEQRAWVVNVNSIPEPGSGGVLMTLLGFLLMIHGRRKRRTMERTAS